MLARHCLSPLVIVSLAFLGCAPSEEGAPDAGDARVPSSDAAPRDAGPVVMDTDAGETDAGETDAGPPAMPDAGPPVACAAPFRPMVAYDGSEAALGDDFLAWRRSVYDGTHAVSRGSAVRVSTNPGDEPLPACSGGHFFAGRTALPAPVPQGRTIWFRIYQYIPSAFSFGYKYSRHAGDRDAARACGQYEDGNVSVKWLVLAPDRDFGTARIYLNTSSVRRALRSSEPRVRVISEALHRPHDVSLDLPRDRWFALQMAVHVSDGDDGFIRAWIDDRYLGEVRGPTTVPDAPLASWGMGDYWNGVPWTDGAPGRTDFWVDEIVVASDADGYEPPTGVDSEGNAYIAPCTRVAHLVE